NGIRVCFPAGDRSQPQGVSAYLQAVRRQTCDLKASPERSEGQVSLPRVVLRQIRIDGIPIRYSGIRLDHLTAVHPSVPRIRRIQGHVRSQANARGVFTEG